MLTPVHHQVEDETQRDINVLLNRVEGGDLDNLRLIWRNHLGGRFPEYLPKWLLIQIFGYRLQVEAYGDLDPIVKRRLRQGADNCMPFATRSPTAENGTTLAPGTLIVREWKGRSERVMVLEKGFAWNGRNWNSLSQIAKALTGTHWNGHRFFFGNRAKSP